ncbi:MAG: beta-galactosidase [Lachnospiraceae bacterium]
MNKEQNDFILFGGDYNPDQWDEQTINTDMKMFRKLGINTVTLPVFSWTKLEPEEGIYTFEWLDKIMDLLWDNKIYVILATPTTAQPAWLSLKHPEVLPVDISGRKRTHGMRVFFCINSEKYRERAAAIASKMANRYKNHPGLLGWHVANEYGTYCYCDNCQNKFRIWLKNKYQTLDNLNTKWNTAFWGRTLTSFEEIMLPTELNDDYRFNPVVQLEYMRFMTDSTASCYLNEAEILKNSTPHLPVFSNISGFIKKLNQHKMVSHMDIAGWDNYPAPKDARSMPAMKLDIMRGLKDGKSFYVVEQSPNQQNWQPYNKLKRPGEIRRIAYQGLAHGSDSCLFFQMRQSQSGQEKFHGAILSHNGRDDTRIFGECEKLGMEFSRLQGTFTGGTTNAFVGMIFDWDSWWALELSSGPTQDMNYLEQVHYYYKQFYDQNIAVDIIRSEIDYFKYKILVAPLYYMVDRKTAHKIENFVKNGGILISTYMTGYADETDRCLHGAYPGLLRDTLGIWVEETDALFPNERNHVQLSESGEIYECSFLCDVIHTKTAEVLAEYQDDFYAGMPAVTRNLFGSGKAYYLGTQLGEAYLQELIGGICRDNQIYPRFEFEGDVEIAVRTKNGKEHIFIINYGTSDGMIDLQEELRTDILTDKSYTGRMNLDSGEVYVLV